MSIKYTNEPPQGIKAGLKRTYAGISQDFLDISNMPQVETHALRRGIPTHLRTGTLWIPYSPAYRYVMGSLFTCVQLRTRDSYTPAYRYVMGSLFTRVQLRTRDSYTPAYG